MDQEGEEEWGRRLHGREGELLRRRRFEVRRLILLRRRRVQVGGRSNEGSYDTIARQNDEPRRPRKVVSFCKNRTSGDNWGLTMTAL